MKKRKCNCIWFKGRALMEMFWLCDFFGGYGRKGVVENVRLEVVIVLRWNIHVWWC